MELSEHLKQALETECGHSLDDVLSHKTPEAYEQLRSVLTTEEDIAPRLRQNAISLLGRWGNPAAVPDIVALLPTLDARDRINAIDALGRLGTSEAEKAIEDQAEDRDPDVRRFAVYALERIGDDAAIAKLREVARKDETGFVRGKALQLLRRREQAP